MKPAATEQDRANSSQRLLTAFTRGASIIALSIGAMLGQANAKTLPAAIQNLYANNLHSSHLNAKQRLSPETKTQRSARFNSILKAAQTPGWLLEQAALSWPPQFAIGQTWTVNIVGVGNWTLPLSTTISGDATGFTTGTDKREGWFRYYPKTASDSDYVLNFLQADADTYVCSIDPQGNPSGNTLNGSAFRVKPGNNQPENLKTTCSATLGAASGGTSPFATPTNPTVPLNPNTAQGSSLAWPPKPGEAWTMTIDGLAPWAVNFEKLDKDGDPTGPAVQGSAQFTGFAYKNKDGYVFEVVDRTTVYDCIFATLQIQGNAFVGGKAYSGASNANSLPPLNKSCSAALGASAGNQNSNQAQNLSWPPQLAVGQNWDYRLGTRPVVYHGNFSSVANDIYKGDLITDGTGDPVAKRALSVVFSSKDDALISFAEDPQGGITGCLFTGKGSIQNNVYVGATLFKAPGAKDFVDQNTDCRMNAVTAATNPTGNQTSNLTPSWPPKQGENWTVTIDGLAPWAINFEKLDKDGNPTGTAIQSGARFVATAYKDSDGYEFEILDRNNVYFCTFTSLQTQGNAFVGGKAYAGPITAQSIPSLNKSCNAAIGSSSASTTTSPFATNPSQTPSLSWPPAIAIGQTWSFAVQNGGSWSITLEKASSIAGAFSGSVKGSDARNNGLIGYDSQGDYTVAAVYGTTDTWLCLAAKSGFSGSSITGETYRAVGSANPAKTGTSCTISPASAASANTGGTTLGGLFGNTGGTQTNTATGLSWPVQVVVGQTWSVNVNKIIFQLKLERVNNGITIGTATSSSGELAGGFLTQGDNLNLVLTDGTATITCTFSRSSIQGQSLNGQATFSEKPNTPEKSLGACSATLAPRASSNADPLAFMPKNLLNLDSEQDLMLKRYSSL